MCLWYFDSMTLLTSWPAKKRKKTQQPWQLKQPLVSLFFFCFFLIALTAQLKANTIVLANMQWHFQKPCPSGGIGPQRCSREALDIKGLGLIMKYLQLLPLTRINNPSKLLLFLLLYHYGHIMNFGKVKDRCF